MSGVLSRGNVILAVSWAMAIGMFLNRAASTNGGGRDVSPPSPQARTPDAAATVVAPVEEASDVEAPASLAVQPGEALSRVDSVVPMR